MTAGPQERFGDLARRTRVAAGLTQEEVAERSGLSVRAIGDIERGLTARPHRSSLDMLSIALGLSAVDARGLLAGGDGGNGYHPAHLHAADAQLPGGVVPRQLPAVIRHFAGRAAELLALDRLLEQLRDPRGAAVIGVIGGSAGVGKTTLALHWAHGVTEHFPDGQLYLNLRGFDPSGSVMTGAEAVRLLLDALNVPASQIPSSQEAQTGLYRSLMVGKRVLIVLDNARDAEQVRPLLPGSPGCLVLVTSRSQLMSLVAAEAAHVLSLGVLSEPEARELLSGRLGANRIRDETAAVDSLIGLCARLPLALAIVAARAELGPPGTLTLLATELQDGAGQLAALNAGDDVTASARAVFSWSYQNLSAPAARMFRLLSVHPGPDLSVSAAAALADVSAERARELLEDLAQATMVSVPVAGRYAFHDLLRAYARELGRETDAQGDPRLAIHRMLNYYLHSAYAAGQTVHPRHCVAAPQQQPGVKAESFGGYHEAVVWLETERQVLLATLALAASEGFDDYAMQLPASTAIFLGQRGHIADLVASQQIALAAAGRLGDKRAEGRALRSLGNASVLRGATDEARDYYERALELAREVGDPGEVGKAYCDQSFMLIRLGRYPEAMGSCAQALDLFRAAGDRCGQAAMLNNLSWCYGQTGDYSAAITCGTQAITMYQDAGDRLGESDAWDTLACGRYRQGNYAEAIACHERVLALAADLTDRPRQAKALDQLGDIYAETGDKTSAHGAWRAALDMLQDLQPRDADLIRVKLNSPG